MESHEFEPELWHPKHEHIELVQGYHMELVAAVENRVYLEGLLCTEHLRERWQLYCVDVCLGEWEFDGDHDAENIWQTVGHYIVDFEPELYTDIRLAWFAAFPHTREEALAERARLIYENGQALKFICDSCAKIHVGDELAIKSMILSYAAIRVRNGEGIHISLSGSAGTGKSHTAKTVAKHLPQENVSDARLSDKALVYHKFKEGTVLLLDDQELSEDFQELLKVASTSWNTAAKYITVKNQQSLELEIPPRCPFWVIKANMTGDEQVHDRQLVLWTDDSLEQLQSIQQSILVSAMDPDATAPQDDIEISRAIWQYIPRETVVIPFAGEIELDEHMDPRNIKLFKSLVEAIALMDASNRVRNSRGYIEATKEDFVAAANIMNPLLGNKGGSQKLKLSAAAAKILDFLRGEQSGDIPFDEARKYLKMSKAVLSQALYGRNDTRTEGLLAVCPAVDVVDISVTSTASGGVTRSSRQKAIRWSKEAYDRWLESAGQFTLKTVNPDAGLPPAVNHN